MRKGLMALLSTSLIISGTTVGAFAETGGNETPELFVSETQEEILSEESASGEIVADAIKEILEATSQMDEADADGLDRLQEYIDATREAVAELPGEAQEALSESAELLENAAVAADSMQDALQQIEETGTFTIEQTGLPNSWRFVNGVPIDEAISVVKQEMKDVAELELDGEEIAGEGEEIFEEKEVTAPEETLPEEAEEWLPEVKEPATETPAEETPAKEDAAGEEQTETAPAKEEVVEVDLSEMTRVEEDADGIATRNSQPLRGIDISRWNWNKPIDWNKVKSSVDYVIIQCGFGDDLKSQDDRRWAESVAACEKYGIPYGVYLYSYATTEKMIDSEVAHTLRLLKGHNPTYPVYLDVEENAQLKLGDKKLSALASRYCSKISAAGYRAGVYSSTSWWNNYLVTFAKDDRFYHWVAHWAEKCGYQGRYEMWQYTSEGKVNGIEGYVDMNYWYGENYANVEPGLYEIVSAINQDYCLDIAGGSRGDGANLQIYKRNDSFAQRFYITRSGDAYKIMCARSGKYLDVRGNGKKNGTNIWQYAGNNTDAQAFKFVQRGGGRLEIQGVASEKYLDVYCGKAANGQNVQLYNGNHSAAQCWYLKKAEDPLPRMGLYEIHSAKNRDYVIDISGGSAKNNANVQLYKRNGTEAQRFIFLPLGHDSLYQIANIKSGKSLDVSGNGKRNGTNVVQYTINETEAQTFRILPVGNGQFEIQGLGSGKMLDLAGGAARNGGNIQIWEANGTAAQKWILEKVEVA